MRSLDRHPGSPRVVTAWSERPWGEPWAGRDAVIAEALTYIEVRVVVTGMAPPESVVLRRDGGARGGMADELAASIDPADFDTLALALAFARETAVPPSPSVDPEAAYDAALAAFPARERLIFAMRQPRDDGTWPTVAEIAVGAGVTVEAAGDIIDRIDRALRRAVPPPPTDTGSTGVRITRSAGEEITAASAWGSPSDLVSIASRLVGEISFGLEWRPVSSAAGDGRRGRWAPLAIAPAQKPPDPLPFEVTCPKRADGILVAHRARRTGGVFWGCSRYPRCDFRTDDSPTGAVHDVSTAVVPETVAAHADGRGAVARRGAAGVCLTCGAVLDLPEGDLVGLRLVGWVCPDHGPASVVVLTSRAGRTYGACAEDGCYEYQAPP